MSNWQEHTSEVTIGGRRLRVAYAAVRSAPVESRRGDPVVYLHGLGSTRSDFAAAAEAPELAGRPLVALDLPGSGASRVPPEVEVGLDGLVEAVAQVLDAIGGPAHLIGHSLGGLAGLLLASADGDRVRSFVNVEGNLAPVDCRVFSRRVSELAAALPAAEVLERIGDELERSPRRGYADFAASFRAAVQPRAFVDYCRDILAASTERGLLDAFVRLDMPRLFVYGEDNGDLPYLDVLRNHGVETVEIAGSDHFPMASNARDFFAAIGGFLDRQSSACGETG